MRRDLPLLRLALEGLRKHAKGLQNVYVVTSDQNLELFRRELPDSVILLDEEEVIPGMTLEELRQYPLPFFPGGAGWYFQQFLKLHVAAEISSTEYCLVWDADTIPLRKIDFFDETGKTFFTKATECHQPYFRTFERLFGFEADREFSFISQHIMLKRDFLREMIDAIHNKNSGNEHWTWKVMKACGKTGCNLFSEYETYGHFLKKKHPEVMQFRSLNWLRKGISLARLPHGLESLVKAPSELDFIALEYNLSFTRYALRKTKIIVMQTLYNLLSK